MVANSAVHEATWRWIRIVTFARSRAPTRLLLPLGEKGSEVQVCAGRKLDLKNLVLSSVEELMHF